MTREQLEHIIRAAAANADTDRVVIIGSQAVLGVAPDLDDPVLCASAEADVFPPDFPERAILIDGAIGERSVFHETFGCYARGAGPETAALPGGWQERLIPVCNENTRGCTGLCLDPHDLAVAKLVAAREKDIRLVRAMLERGLVRPARIAELIDALPEKEKWRAPEAKARLGRIVGHSGGQSV